MQLFQGVKNFINSKAQPKESDFQNYGYLTPAQFVTSGDLLANCGWAWCKATSKPMPGLPEDKQFLRSKCESIERTKDVTERACKESDLDGFVYPRCELNDKEDLQKLRNYELFITYDVYYHCPRMWLKATDCEGRPLSSASILEDVMQASRNQTVTEEVHPGMDVRMVTIHPCKHSEVFKMFIDRIKAKGRKPDPKHALFMFLKFLGSIIPTIKYDFSIDIDL